ncbi:MAG: very short patch repair endonuclease [Bacteroidales bacterium]|nr:very short patch repair endonuclease [Bacteroidales bacterium]
MAAIGSKNTKPEMIVRKYLWHLGFRYRLNDHRLPGRPDLVLKKFRTCIFVNGCFWHGHLLQIPFNHFSLTKSLQSTIQSSACCKIPKTHTEFWVKKIVRNKKRDAEVQKQIAKMGWHTVTVWECELSPKRREQTLQSLAFTLNRIFLDDCRKPLIERPIRKGVRYQIESEENAEEMLIAAEEEAIAHTHATCKE